MNRTTLEQWRMLQAVVEQGGFAQAAAAIHKSQSTINHAVHKLQDQLGVPVLEVVGRKAQLTEAGALLLRRAGQLLAQASQLEDIATSLAQGTEAEIHLAVDELYPTEHLARVMDLFSTRYPNTRIELYETILSGGAERLLRGEVGMLIASAVPGGFLGEPIRQAEFVAVAAADHALHQYGRPLTLQDLARERQIVVRDSAQDRRTDSGWLGAEQRWTVSHVATSIELVGRGLGFAWLPVSRVSAALDAGDIQALPLERGARRYATLYLTLADPDCAGPATRDLAGLFRSQAL
ncbi:MAG: LysR family transcriptional regulator [Halieaceae bacterium]|uniref:LysR family transcriptional regulator n=1 Tax=Haliea alexandrii TaxID=2448162 RepID=UPI0018EE8F62|nr:LysR family transcriptional regulator [Haliea alexandrii]MCR9187099.1 LysR family transcriptional regulator [Halieaceae bacterium]